jgi:hypothetical protein
MSRVGFLLKLLPEEDRLFRREAKKNGLPVSGWLRLAARAAIHEGNPMRSTNGIKGIAVEGPGDRATFTVGLRVDKPRSQSIVGRKGATITPRRARAELVRIREEQVGRLGAAATIVKCEGVWGGRPETALTCEIEYVPSPKETRRATFRKNMLDLAEKAAERLGQEEVWLRMGGKLYRANAPSERGPKPLRRGGKVIR